MNGLCANPRLSGGLACSAGPWSPARGGCGGGAGPWRNTRARRAISRAAPARVLLAASHSPCIRGSAAQGGVRDTGAPAVAPAKKRRSKNAAAWRRKKGHPPSFVLLVAQSHRKIILSSVVATSTFYARTRVRSRLRTQRKNSKQ